MKMPRTKNYLYTDSYAYGRINNKFIRLGGRHINNYLRNELPKIQYSLNSTKYAMGTNSMTTKPSFIKFFCDKGD